MKRPGQSALRFILAMFVASVAPPLFAADPAREEVLRGLGRAIATDWKFNFRGVVLVEGTTVTGANEAEWEKKLEEALALLYAPPNETIRSLRYSLLKDDSKVEMGGKRTPEQVVRDVVAPGRTIVTVRWSLGADFPSFAVFDGNTILFDTLLSMPVINKPIFSVPHL